MKNVGLTGASDICEIKVDIEITIMPRDGERCDEGDARSRSFASNLMENGCSGGTRI
jgi:hypothetical protein